ncbi:MAG: hypothetical protein WCC63_07160, partial [Candidatus Bathyarchaeia archaeon]
MIVAGFEKPLKPFSNMLIICLHTYQGQPLRNAVNMRIDGQSRLLGAEEQHNISGLGPYAR